MCKYICTNDRQSAIIAKMCILKHKKYVTNFGRQVQQVN